MFGRFGIKGGFELFNKQCIKMQVPLKSLLWGADNIKHLRRIIHSVNSSAQVVLQIRIQKVKIAAGFSVVNNCVAQNVQTVDMQFHLTAVLYDFTS